MLTKENILFSKPLLGRAKATDILEPVKQFQAEQWKQTQCSMHRPCTSNFHLWPVEASPSSQLVVFHMSWSDSNHFAHNAGGSLAGCRCRVLRSREVSQCLVERFQQGVGQKTFFSTAKKCVTSRSWVFKLLPPQKHHCETVQQGGVNFQTYLKNTAGDGTLLSHKQERSAAIWHNTRTAKKIMPREGNPAQKVTYYMIPFTWNI